MTSGNKKEPLSPNEKARQAFRKDLEKIFKLALAEQQYATALKAKELLAKEAGIIPAISKTKQDKKVDTSISAQDLNDDMLNALIQALGKSNH